MAAREPASAISRAMVMETSGQGWCDQVGIPGPEQPVGHFHPQGIGTFETPFLFQQAQALFERVQG